MRTKLFRVRQELQSCQEVSSAPHPDSTVIANGRLATARNVADLLWMLVSSRSKMTARNRMCGLTFEPTGTVAAWRPGRGCGSMRATKRLAARAMRGVSGWSEGLWRRRPQPEGYARAPSSPAPRCWRAMARQITRGQRCTADFADNGVGKPVEAIDTCAEAEVTEEDPAAGSRRVGHAVLLKLGEKRFGD